MLIVILEISVYTVPRADYRNPKLVNPTSTFIESEKLVRTHALFLRPLCLQLQGTYEFRNDDGAIVGEVLGEPVSVPKPAVYS